MQYGLTEVLNLLDSMNIPYEKLKHFAAVTVEDADIYSKGKDFTRVKNLLLKNNHGFYLAVVPAHHRLDANLLRDDLHTSRLSFANADDLERKLAIKRGAVSPFNLLNNQGHDVLLAFDERVAQPDVRIGIPGNDNSMTLIVKYTDVVRVIEKFGNPITITKMF